MEGGLLSLKWNDHSNTFFDMLSTIRRKESYCDVTLVSDGRFYPVHKLVLSTCSEFFDNLFSRTDCKHPVVIVANVSYKDLEALLNYMYLGEVNVLQNELGNLMKAAEVLRVKGLAENKPQNKDLRDTYRSSPSEFTDAGGKRKRSEDVNSPTAKRSAAKSQFSSDPQALKNTVHDNAGCSASETSDSKEPFSSSKGLANVPPAPSQEPGISAASRGDSRDQGSNDKAVRPEVKVEEILIKDEPGGWFGDCEEVGENVQFSEPDTSLDYNPQSMDYSGSCLPWELPATTQPHPIEGHLPQGMPGASGMQGDPLSLNERAPTKKWRKMGNKERARLLELAKANPKQSSEKLRRLLMAEFNTDISARTIRRELLDAGIKTYKPVNSYFFPQMQYESNDQNIFNSIVQDESVNWNASGNNG